MSVNSRLKVKQIIGQTKAFYRQRIPEPCYARKETFEIDVFVKSRNGDIKIMRSIRIMSRPPKHLRTAGSIEAFFFSNKFD